MTQVNQTMEDLAGKLDGFSDAVARGDLVTMRTQADNAFKSIEDLNKIQAPEDMKKIQAEYVEGCNDLKDAMNAYIGLYSEIESATDDQPFDYGTYDERLKAIQDQYDKGIGKLQSGDNKASERPRRPVPSRARQVLQESALPGRLACVGEPCMGMGGKGARRRG